MVHSRLDPIESTSAPLPRRLDAPLKTNRLDASHEINHHHLHNHRASETVVNQQLANMEIDTRTSLPNALLRHRLFPRAMAWNVHQAAHQGHSSARYENDYAYPSRNDEYSSGYASGYAPRPLKTAKHHAHGSPRSSPASHDVESRERLFRTIGKYLDQRPSEASGLYSRSQPQFLQHQSQQPQPPVHYARHAPSSYDAPLPRGGSASLYDMVHLHHGNGNHSPSYTASSSRSMSISSPTHSHSSDGSNSKKRQRGPSGSTVPPSSGGAVARPGMSTSSAKRCSVQDCGKIAVSKGLCRGHGGGRRCTFAGCTKCAQSRSPFCWAHGGGKRCEAPNCRRSRKTKRFCVDHVEMEATVPIAMSTDSDSDHHHRSLAVVDTDMAAASHSVAEPHNLAALHLPSLTDALKRAVPAAVARASQTVTLPQSRDRLWPAAQPAASMASFH